MKARRGRRKRRHSSKRDGGERVPSLMLLLKFFADVFFFSYLPNPPGYLQHIISVGKCKSFFDLDAMRCPSRGCETLRYSCDPRGDRLTEIQILTLTHTGIRTQTHITQRTATTNCRRFVFHTSFLAMSVSTIQKKPASILTSQERDGAVLFEQ